MSNVLITGHLGWPAYDMFLIISLIGQPVYDPNLLRHNPNKWKPVSCSRVVSNIDTLKEKMMWMTLKKKKKKKASSHVQSPCDEASRMIMIIGN